MIIIPKFLEPSHRNKITVQMKSLSFSFVTWDLERLTEGKKMSGLFDIILRRWKGDSFINLAQVIRRRFHYVWLCTELEAMVTDEKLCHEMNKNQVDVALTYICLILYYVYTL